MPLTAHGKVDRPALAAIRQELKVAGSDFVAPRNTTEEVLAGIWADLLEVEEIGVFDNFFDLGGHSLLAGRALARVAECLRGVVADQGAFRSTYGRGSGPADQTRHARRRSIEPPLEIARGERDGPQPVSILQEHVLRIERELPGLPQFNLPFAYRLQGPLNVPALERSLVEVVRRHDSLRTGFAWVDERPVALIAPTSDFDSSSRRRRSCSRDTCRKRPRQGTPAQEGGAASRARSLDTLRHKPCAVVPDAPLAARRRRPRLAPDPAPYHRRRLVDRQSSWRKSRSSTPLCDRSTSAVARAGVSVFRLRSLAASVVHQRGSDPAVRLLEASPARGLTRISPDGRPEGALLSSRVAHEPIHLSKDSGCAPALVEPSPRGNLVHDVAGGLQDYAVGPKRTQ